MNICVLGLWHLGSVISASVLKGHKVIGIDQNTKIINNLNRNKAPIYEPHLNKLIKKGISSGNLTLQIIKKKQLMQKFYG